VQPNHPIAGRTIATIEAEHGVRVLAHERAGATLNTMPEPQQTIAAGERVIVHLPAHKADRFIATRSPQSAETQPA
jgi:Trk K+ transport system NAD-binding subunit